LFTIDHVGAILLNATCRKKDRGPREDIYLLYRESGALRENGEENHGSVKHVFVTVFDETIVPSDLDRKDLASLNFFFYASLEISVPQTRDSEINISLRHFPLCEDSVESSRFLRMSTATK